MANVIFYKQNISKALLIKNLEKIMRILIPFIPHLANECLYKLKIKDVYKWPIIEKKNIREVKIKLIIQTNGKTRDVIQLDKEVGEEKLINFVTKETKVKKFLKGKTIIKQIYIKNKLINFVIN